MKRILIPVFLIIITSGLLSSQTNQSEIIFDSPATHFTRSLPLGNGRLGAMIFGDPHHERIVLNEISLWSGGPQNADRDSARYFLPAIRDFLLNGDNASAQELLRREFVAKGAGSGFGNGANVPFGCYQTAGELRVDYNNIGTVTDYHRVLDLEAAKSKVSFRVNDTRIIQEAFCDFSDDVIRIRWHSSAPAGLNFSLSLFRKENVSSVNYKHGVLSLEGTLPNGENKGMSYGIRLKVIGCDGNFNFSNGKLNISNADTCSVIIAIRTNYNYAAGGLLPSTIVSKSLKSDLKASTCHDFHRAWIKSSAIYQKYFNACRLQLFPDENQKVNSLTTPQRLEQYANGGSDVGLPVLYFNFGRYLMICSSKPGLLPTNLQGLWAEEYQTPWNGDYHLNINLQMNYWLAETTNLPAQLKPLFQWTSRLVPNGRKTATAYYGAKGWVAHVISNPWLFTSPGEGADWGSTMTGGAWLACQLWEHYLFSKDTLFLRQYYPVIREAAEFLADVMITEKVHGWLVTAPSNSPENTYIMPGGFHGNTCMGPTMDNQIARQLFNAVIEASELLDIDKGLREILADKVNRLPPTRISPTDGGIMEWLDDWPSAEPHHRHVSQLFGLFPGDEITPFDTPELAVAARKTLELRGDGGTGWSKAWKMCFYARLGDGAYTLKLLKALLKPAASGGGTYDNLFDAHPPYQIDGNFGATAAIAEMFVQSHGREEIIRLLPALPDDKDWANGRISGLRARGNYEISLEWNDHVLLNAVILAHNDGQCRIVLPENMIIYDEAGTEIPLTMTKDCFSFSVKAGKKYFVKNSLR